PVVAVLTTPECAVPALPPEDPDPTRTTPRTCLNTASTPQKQPPANTATSVAGARESWAGAATVTSGKTSSRTARMVLEVWWETVWSYSRRRRPLSRIALRLDATDTV